jgi:hypothetical protein
MIVEQGIVTEVSTEEVKNDPRNKLGGIRPTPRFRTPLVAKKNKALESVSRAVPDNLPTNGNIPVMKKLAVVSEVPPVAEETQRPDDLVAAHVVHASEELQQAPKIVPKEKMVEATTKAIPSDVVLKHKTRVAEIKREVNMRVGNPATLIDNGNQIGREYIGTLLTAMKSTSGKSADDLETAMSKLEEAHKKILEYALKTEEIKDEQKVPGTRMPPPAQEVKDPQPPVATEVPEVRKKDDVALKAELAALEEKKKASLADIKRLVSESKLGKDSSNETQNKDPEQEEELKAVTVEIPSSGKSEVAREVPVPSAIAAERQVGAPRVSRIPSLAEQAGYVKVAPTTESPASFDSPQAYVSMPAQQFSDQATTAPGTSPIVKTIEGGNPLPKKLYNPQARNEYTPSVPDVQGEPQRTREVQADLNSAEVTLALEHLLDDWGLFKRSGILGLGPGGIKHPLYQKMAQVSMFFVTSGRFEGATPDVRQSILDYVNAWRHEQGITYSPSETFEHYLRRVIARILKRQNQSVDA